MVAFSCALDNSGELKSPGVDVWASTGVGEALSSVLIRVSSAATCAKFQGSPLVSVRQTMFSKTVNNTARLPSICPRRRV